MTDRLIYSEFSRVEKMKGLVKVLAPILGKDLGKVMVDDGTGKWITFDSPAIYLGNPNVPSPDYPRIVLTFLGANDLDGAQVDAGWYEVDNPDYNPDDPDSQQKVEVPYVSKQMKYMINVQAECGNLDEVYQGKRKSSSELLTKMLNYFLFDSVRKNMNDFMESTIAQTNRIIPQVDIDNTTYHDTSSTILLFHCGTTNYDYSSGVFDTVEYDYELYRKPEDPDPIKGSETIPHQALA